MHVLTIKLAGNFGGTKLHVKYRLKCRIHLHKYCFGKVHVTLSISSISVATINSLKLCFVKKIPAIQYTCALPDGPSHTVHMHMCIIILYRTIGHSTTMPTCTLAVVYSYSKSY